MTTSLCHAVTPERYRAHVGKNADLATHGVSYVSGKRGNRRPSKFKQSDVQRALAAVAKSGASVVLEIAPDGTIRLVPASETMSAQAPDTKRLIVL